MVLTLAAIGYALALILLTLAILARLDRAPIVAAETGDPHAAEVAEFARQVADWDRGGGHA